MFRKFKSLISANASKPFKKRDSVVETLLRSLKRSFSSLSLSSDAMEPPKKKAIFKKKLQDNSDNLTSLEVHTRDDRVSMPLLSPEECKRCFTGLHPSLSPISMKTPKQSHAINHKRRQPPVQTPPNKQSQTPHITPMPFKSPPTLRLKKSMSSINTSHNFATFKSAVSRSKNRTKLEQTHVARVDSIDASSIEFELEQEHKEV